MVLGLGLGWGAGCHNIENNPRWVRVRVRIRVSLFCYADV